MRPQVSAVEFALVEKTVLFGLQQGNKVLNELHAEMSIESVEKLMGETMDAIAYQRVCTSLHVELKMRAKSNMIT
jgi:hypothetical protein